VKTILCLAVGLTAFGFSVGGASAQVRGSYLQSCPNVTMEGPLIVAGCLDRNGQVRASRIDPRSCRGDIANNNGRLTCGGGGGGAAPPPPQRRGDFDGRRDDRRDDRRFDRRGDDRRGYDDRRRRFEDDEPPRRRRYEERW
jgi:hypothetical protein